MGPHCFPEKPRTQVNFSALIEAFQQLTVAIEHVLSTALRPPMLNPQPRSWPAERCNVGSGIRASHSRCCRLQCPPNYDVNAWTLIPEFLPARICSALRFKNTSPQGRSGKGLGKATLSTAQIQSRTSLHHTPGLKMSKYFSGVNASPVTGQSARIVIAAETQKIKCLTQGNKTRWWELPEYKCAFLIPRFMKRVT